MKTNQVPGFSSGFTDHTPLNES